MPETTNEIRTCVDASMFDFENDTDSSGYVYGGIGMGKEDSLNESCMSEKTYLIIQSNFR